MAVLHATWDPSPVPPEMEDQPSPVDPGREPAAETPRWVKTAVIIGLVLVVLVVVLLLVGGEHGPGRH